MRIAVATSRDHRTEDPDLPLLRAAAEDTGVRLDVVPWDDPDIDFDHYDLTIIRSCWDYVPRRTEFLAWTERVPRLHNSAAVVAWNTDKTYLRQLERSGVTIIGTQWSVRTGDDLGDHAEWVVKPTISAGSADTARWSTAAEVHAHSERLLDAGRPTMTQPYVDSVDTHGETALVYLGGTFSHAIRKGPMLARGQAARAAPEMREAISPRTPTSDELALGRRTLDVTCDLLDTELLYARVDVVTDRDGQVRLMELELTEPSLFLPHSTDGAARLIEAAVRRG
ncbi:hypothetical protein HMPREF0063_12308 [Aeromicrobium marinum DSM 15272]|uniref:ATP-grasp domain-containing protein n=1 Tax=Aeromicrobium marinum DSM 15272 TaxID=585531 RepID=E2SCZ6_9ACTN|nr:hypothetical protein [Aeromicrobium marinum]EFQ83099.1 hypothetical protein HMPREF0063_12308 [Aeromicrobium marinum DSM 15272]